MKRQFLKLLLIIAATFLMIAVASAAEEAGNSIDFEPAKAEPVSGQGLVIEPKGATGPATYIVVLDEAPLASYRGGKSGLSATNPSAIGENKVDANSSASAAYLSYLGDIRAASIDSANKALGRNLDVDYEYGAAIVGYAAEMTPAEAAIVAKQQGVLFVEREKMSYPQTDAGPSWIGASAIWDGSATGGDGFLGEGIIVGVIDTGIDPWNPSFAATGDDGYTHTNPLGEGTYLGVCDPTNTSPPDGTVAYDPTFPCNDKLIGVWGYTASDGNPRDADGHGSHTASTAAGNYIEDAVVETPTDTYMATISGVAPHANIIAYDGCIDGGGCPGASLNAARDQLILDGVDAVNYSIGSSSPTGDPWTDSESLQWLAIRDAGIFVATSAGNAGPGDATIGSPGDLPWLTTVGASSHNRAFLQELTLDDGSGNPLTLNGLAMTAGFGPAPVVFSIDFADPDNGISEEDARLCADGIFPAGTFDGQIVVCERGTYGRVAKGQTVKDGGAGGYVLAQPEEFGGGPGSLLADPHVLPGIHIDFETYQALLDYLDNAAGTVNGTFAGTTQDIDDSHGDVMASFSSRGPNGGFFNDLIVPNVTAPGRDIWAAYHQGDGGDGDFTWNVISGTSMSSPHVAGAGALLAGVHPDWTPAQIESALSSTAVQDVINDDGVNQATPFAMGGGRVDLVAASQAGLLLDVSKQDFDDADPRLGGDPTSLNIANLGNAQCVLECSWTRTVSNPTDASVSWTAMVEVPEGATATVSPENFSLDPGATQEIMVTVMVGTSEADTWYFGELKLMTDAEGISDAHLPIAFQPSTGDIPDLVTINTRRDAGSQIIPDVTSIPASNLTISESGLTQSMQNDIMLPQDSNNDDPYDPIDEVWVMVYDVPEGATRFVAEVTDSSAPDIDLYVGTGDTPGADTEACSSTTGSFVEYCNLNNPAEGQYWVLVQNWDGSGEELDSVKLHVGIVTGDEGNMTVSGPTSVGALEPFDLTVFYDQEMESGQIWYGSTILGTDPDNLGDIGTINIDLHRLDDDATKTASTTLAMPGDMITYTITIEPNVTNQDLTYSIIDNIPDGLTLVPDSATASSGSITSGLNTVFWSGLLPSPSNLEVGYSMTTSANDPSCDTGFGGYVDLESFGLLAASDIEGDTVGFTAFTDGDPINFYGTEYSGMSFTDDGFAIFDIASNYGGSPWEPQMLPNPGVPNNLAAMMWMDGEIFYDETLNYGVTLATAGAPGGVVIVEYDNLQPFEGSETDMYDMEIVVSRAVDNTPGVYEIVFAYDNLMGELPNPTTIGVENASGDTALALVNAAAADSTISDGFMVCFDQVGTGAEPVVITYQVTVDEDASLGVISNDVVVKTSNIGSDDLVVQSGVYIGYPTFFAIIPLNDGA